MNKLYFLIGLPRSGKSSFSKKWVEDKINILENNIYTENKNCYCQNLNPRVIVCADDIRLALGHRWNGLVEPYVNATKLTMIRTLLQKHDVLVDGTHTTERSIRELLDINKDAIPYYIPTSPEECKKRAKETNQKDLYPIIDRMYNQIVELANDETYYSSMIVEIMDKIDNMRHNIYPPEIRD